MYVNIRIKNIYTLYTVYIFVYVFVYKLMYHINVCVNTRGHRKADFSIDVLLTNQILRAICNRMTKEIRALYPSLISNWEYIQ